MKQPIATAELKRLADLVEQELAKLPEIRFGERNTIEKHRDATTALATRLADREGAVWRDGGNAFSFRLAGISSTSTSSLDGAMRNWLAAARKRIDGGAS